jgi:predicted SAM-dependent methyltransferase
MGTEPPGSEKKMIRETFWLTNSLSMCVASSTTNVVNVDTQTLVACGLASKNIFLRRMKSRTLRKWLWDLRCRMRIRERATTSFFRWRSLLSRKFLIKSYFGSNGLKKLQVGCGKNPLNGWLNTDLLATSEVIYMDATKPLPIPDNSLDYIFTEHVFEHINYSDGNSFLKEAYRVLKPGGRIRIATPDLSFLIRLYSKPDTEVAIRYIKNSVDRYVREPKVYEEAVVVNNFFYNWGHQFIYDFEMLNFTLQSAGFTKAIRFNPLESTDANLRNLEAHGKMIGEEFNLIETIVVEAEKA